MPPMPVELLTLAAHPVEQASEFVGTVKSRMHSAVAKLQELLESVRPEVDR